MKNTIGPLDALDIRLRVEDNWGPLTPAAAKASERNLIPLDKAENRWVRCAAYETLHQQLLEYCEGRVLGHSFLVSGHCGSGKTSLTHRAVQAVRWTAEERLRNDVPIAIPFLVPLHGPDLLNTEGADDQVRTRHAVQQIVLALQRSYVDELIKRFHRAVRAEHDELAALFTLRLNHYPDLEELRAIWAAADLLSTGGALSNGLPKQGFREIIALQTLNEAVQSRQGEAAIPFNVLGLPSHQTGEGDAGKLALPVRQVRQLIQALSPLLSVIAGFVAAYAVAERIPDPIGRGIVFLATTLIINRFLRGFTPPGSEGALTTGSSLSDLDRILPLLVTRVVDSGFAPVFVIDELDKVPNVSATMS